MVTAQPLARRTTSDQVAQEVRRQIWMGELGAGDRLTQEDLAAAMGVSRIPVREALIALAHEGAIRMAPHRGAFVEGFTETSIIDHYELFGHVDGFALRRAIGRAEPSTLQHLAADLSSASAIGNAGDMQRLVIATRLRFHELGGSPRFHAVSRGLTGLVAGNFFDQVPGTIDVARHRLPELAAEVERGDADAAVAVYEAMMREHGELVLRALQERGMIE